MNDDLRTIRDGEGSFKRRVLEVVALIPAGKVLSYGDVATLVGHARAARAVGTILKNFSEDIPWHRVVNVQMRISGGGRGARALHQHSLLQGEGLDFDRSGRIETPDARWPLADALDAWEDADGNVPQ